MTLTDFLLARIAEDEAVGRESATTGLRWNGPTAIGLNESDIPDTVDIDAGRLLDECEAKRRIVALHRNRYGLGDCESCADGWEDLTTGEAGHNPLLYPCPTLRALALPYADHPDYREEWRS